MSASIVWSDYQSRIFDWSTADETPEPHAVVEATAGSGKTTAIKEVCRRVLERQTSSRLLYVTFSRRLVEEAQEKLRELGDGVTVSTLHSLGLGILRSHWSGLKVDGKKTQKIAASTLERRWHDGLVKRGRTTLLDTGTARGKQRLAHDALARWCEKPHGGRLWSCARALATVVEAARTGALDPVDPEYTRKLGQVLYEREIVVSTEKEERLAIYSVARDIHVEGLEAICPRAKHELAGYVDFGEMLAGPVYHGLPCLDRFDWVVVDEAQDLSPASQELLTILAPPMEEDTRVLAVGDSRQAIFGFAGGDRRSMERLSELYGAQRFSLPVTYRCPESHVRLCQRLAPEMQARPGAPRGEVRRVTREALVEVSQGDLILCRLNAPLMPLCLALIKRGIQARIYGRDVARQLEASAQEATDRYPGESLREAIRCYCQDRAQALRDDEPEIEDDDPRLVAINDLGDTLRVLLDACAEETMPALSAQLKVLFADAGAAVWLSSVHRAKGLEADTVWIERPDLLPLPSADLSDDSAEWCVAFVAASRAKQRLNLLVDGVQRPLADLWAPLEAVNDDADKIDRAELEALELAEALDAEPVIIDTGEDAEAAIAVREELRDDAFGDAGAQMSDDSDVRDEDLEEASTPESAASLSLTQRRQLAALPPWPRATLPERIRMARLWAGMSQHALAEAADVSRRTVAELERTDCYAWKSVALGNVHRIAGVLGYTLGDLFAGL